MVDSVAMAAALLLVRYRYVFCSRFDVPRIVAPGAIAERATTRRAPGVVAVGIARRDVAPDAPREITRRLLFNAVGADWGVAVRAFDVLRGTTRRAVVLGNAVVFTTVFIGLSD